MASDYDATEFVDTDFQAHKTPYASAAGGDDPLRAPTREEVDSKVAETQRRLADLKRAQEELERERASLEETRRRQMEFESGRKEIIHNLTRGLGLLEETEFTARRDAESMAKTLADFRDALAKVEAVHEETWTKDTFSVELTRALTAIENARMEWNAARLKFPVLSGKAQEGEPGAETKTPAQSLKNLSFGELCKMGLALTWPLAVVAALALVIFMAILLRH